MLDIPALGINLLNRILGRIAENEEDSEAYESSEAIIEGCRILVRPSRVREAIKSLTYTHDEQIHSEKLVVRSLMESLQAKES